jgi:competence protein ComGF
MTKTLKTVLRSWFFVTTTNSPSPRERFRKHVSLWRGAAASERRTTNEERRTTATPHAAFTLLEVMLAMGIVTMLVLMIANMFQEVTLSCNIGTQSSEMNTAGRSALDFIARELSQAVAGQFDALNPNPGSDIIKFKISAGNELRFVALSGDVTNGRALRGAMFKQEDNCLKYCRKTDLISFNPYNNDKDPASWNWQGIQPLVTNVTGFQVSAYNSVGGLPLSSWDNTNLPVYVDISLAVIGNDDAKKFNALSGTNATGFQDRNSRRYSTRVYFNNRQGWQGRP